MTTNEGFWNMLCSCCDSNPPGGLQPHRLQAPVTTQEVKMHQVTSENESKDGSHLMSAASRLYEEEVRNMLVIQEHYKLELSLVLHKICLLVRKAKQKQNDKLLLKAKAQVKKTITKVKQNTIKEYGPQHNCQTEEDFEAKLAQMILVSKKVQQLHLELESSISNAIEGDEPGLLLELEDQRLTFEVYQQIVAKVYATIRYRIYQKVKSKTQIRIQKSVRNATSKNMTMRPDPQKSKTNQQINVINQAISPAHEQVPNTPKANTENNLTEDELKDLVMDMDVENVRVDVFKLYEVNPGLDAQLSLRKLQILNSDDTMLQNYLSCLKEAHDRFLSYIFQGHKFQKMEQNPLHSQDLNYGVPQLFNNILDDMLDDTHDVLAEEYQRQQLTRLQEGSPLKSGGKIQFTDLDENQKSTEKQNMELSLGRAKTQIPQKTKNRTSSFANQQRSIALKNVKPNNQEEVNSFGKTPPLDAYTRSNNNSQSPDVIRGNTNVKAPTQKDGLMQEIQLNTGLIKLPMSSKAAMKKNFNFSRQQNNTDSSMEMDDNSETNFKYIEPRQDDRPPTHGKQLTIQSRPFAMDDNNVNLMQSPSNVRVGYKKTAYMLQQMGNDADQQADQSEQLVYNSLQ